MKHGVSHIQNFIANETACSLFNSWIKPWKLAFSLEGEKNKQENEHAKHDVTNVPNSHCFSFVGSPESEDGKAYHRMRQLVLNSREEIIKDSQSKQNRDKLVQWCKKIIYQRDKEGQMQLRMFAILIFYYEFYLKSLTFTQFSKEFKEFFEVLDINEAERIVYEMFLTSTKMNLFSNTDPLTSLFNILDKNLDGVEHPTVLRDCMVNLLAVVMGMPTESNHLYTCIFHPNTMENTLAVGLKSAQKMHRSNNPYDKGRTTKSERQRFKLL